MKTLRILLMIGFLILGMTLPLSAEIYRWKDGKGKIHYSTKPPSHHVTGPVEVKINNRWYPYTGDEDLDALKAKGSAPINYTTSSPGPSLQHTEKTPKQAIVSYSKQESMIIIEVTVNQKITRPFAVDTGATYTIISQEIADALYLRPDPRIPPITIQTANGRIQVSLVNLDSVSVGGLEMLNVTAAIHTFDESSRISGLLGLNFLNRFQMTVDATKNQLILKPIASLSQDCATAKELLHYGRALHDNSNQEASYYKKAISLCPDLVEAYYYLGAVYIHQKNAQQAIKLHQKIIRMQPQEPEAHFRLGLSYILERQFEQAAREFQKTLQLDPNHKQAKEYLARLKKL